MRKMGILSASMKPIHRGHWKLIEIASKENDSVALFVSLNDRIKEGEFPIYGRKMALIWRDHILPVLPENVRPIFLKNESPIKRIYTMLGRAEHEDFGKTLYSIYGDPTDIQNNFPSVEKYCPRLQQEGQLNLVSVAREGNTDISGTKMRKFLKEDEIDEFIKFVPQNMNAKAIYGILKSS